MQALPGAEKIAEPLKLYRGAMAFEEMRLKTDTYSLTHKRPAAFMLTYGGLSMRRARSQFSSNFFACAGFEVIDNNGFATVDEGIEAALAAKAELVVVCSADEDYALIGAEIFQKLNGKALVVIAGNPPCADELKAAGITNFVHVRTNVLEALQQYQKDLGI
jgi:methylmalonyl-CoA mutase